MSHLKVIRLGYDESGPDVYQELARLVGLYLNGRAACGEVTMVGDLRNALARLVDEIDAQMEQMEVPEGKPN